MVGGPPENHHVHIEPSLRNSEAMLEVRHVGTESYRAWRSSVSRVSGGWQTQDVAPRADGIARLARRVRCVMFQSLPSSTMTSRSEKHSKGSWERLHFRFARLHPGGSFSSPMNWGWSGAYFWTWRCPE